MNHSAGGGFGPRGDTTTQGLLATVAGAAAVISQALDEAAAALRKRKTLLGAAAYRKEKCLTRKQDYYCPKVSLYQSKGICNAHFPIKSYVEPLNLGVGGVCSNQDQEKKKNEVTLSSLRN